MDNKTTSEYSSAPAIGTIRAEQLNALIDRLDRVIPILEALGELLIEADYVTAAKRLNKKTISQNRSLEKFNGLWERKVLLKLSSVPVLKQRKRKKC